MKRKLSQQLKSTPIFFCLLLAFLSFPTIGKSQNSLSPEYWLIKNEGIDINNIDFLCEFLKIPSVSGQEKSAGQFLKSICEENGLFVTQLGNTDGNYNFAASLYPLELNKPNVIFMNHIDVVPPGAASEWTYPPFQGQLVDGEIWGRGALDMKGIAASQLFSLLKFKSDLEKSDFAYNVTILAVSAEEITTDLGASYVTENYIDKLNPAVVFSEGPSGLTGIIMSDDAKEVFGISVIDRKPLRVNLKLDQFSSAHGASSPQHYPAKDMTLALGRLLSSPQKVIYTKTNLGMLRSFGEMEKGLMGFVLRFPRLFKPLIAGQIRNNSQMMMFFSNSITLVDYKTISHSSNSIPQSIVCRLDCRLMPAQNSWEFIESLGKKLGNPEIEIEIVDSLPGTEASSSHNGFYTKYQNAIKSSYPSSEVIPAVLPGYSDCVQFRCKGIPAYGSIPMILSVELLSTMHNFDERIPVEALQAGTRIYYDFLVGLTDLDLISENIERYR